MYLDFQTLKKCLIRNDQAHVLENLQNCDTDQFLNTFSTVINENVNPNQEYRPPSKEDITSRSDLSRHDITELTNIGLEAISENKVAVILLSGGQGTRLGVNYPKGMYNVNLPSQKSLFQLQAERLVALKNLVEKKYMKKVRIQWYIMTSESTCDQIRDFFISNDYFGFEVSDILFFEQYTLPSVSFDGKILMKTPSHVAHSPDGNGGIYRALRERGIIDHMNMKGIKHVHVYCVDNILIKMADPEFIGYCIKSKADCGLKTVEKLKPEEGLGVVGFADNRYKIIEYSEISRELAEARDPVEQDKLLFRAGSICIFYFSKDFLENMSREEFESKIPYHLARKVIPIWNGSETVKPKEPNGYKLEKFIFDVFPFSKEDFSALKNPDTKKSECPETSRKSLLDLHRRYAETAGAIFLSDDDCIEIDASVSLFGENLEFMKDVELSGIKRVVRGDKNQPIIM